MNTCEELKETRKRLRRRVPQLGNGGFEYEAIFPPKASSFENHIRVRVMLRGSVEDARYRFVIQVEPRLPSGFNGDQAAEFATWMSRAAKKAKWAEDITRGLSWGMEEMMKGEGDA